MFRGNTLSRQYRRQRLRTGKKTRHPKRRRFFPYRMQARADTERTTGSAPQKGVDKER